MANSDKLYRAAVRFDAVLKDAQSRLGMFRLPKVVLLHNLNTPDRCFYCGNSQEVYSHLRARLFGGRRTPDNIVPACDRCANLKGYKKPRTFRNRFPEIFPNRQFWAEVTHGCSLAETVEVGDGCEL